MNRLKLGMILGMVFTFNTVLFSQEPVAPKIPKIEVDNLVSSLSWKMICVEENEEVSTPTIIVNNIILNTTQSHLLKEYIENHKGDKSKIRKLIFYNKDEAFKKFNIKNNDGVFYLKTKRGEILDFSKLN